MKIVAYEHITGGGYASEPLPPGLADEGGRMLAALCADLAAAGAAVRVLRDARLPALANVAALTVADRRGWHDAWRQALDWADAVWPIAPETGGELERLSREILAAGKRLLGSHPDAVALCASKEATARCLQAAGLPTLPVWPAHLEPQAPGPWVVKPDAGAGCEDTELLDDRNAWQHWLKRQPAPQRFILQPYFAGTAASLSLLCHHNTVELLACNRQHIALEDGRFHLTGCAPQALAERAADWAPLAHAITAAVPGLWGYVGVDLLDQGGDTRILEINPRLTLSYCGLRQALGRNPIQSLLAVPATSPGQPRTH